MRACTQEFTIAQNNFLSQLDNQKHETKKQSANVYFEDKLENCQN